MYLSPCLYEGTNCSFPYCCVAHHNLIPDLTFSAPRSERDSLSPSEWRPDEKMKSFQHRLIPASSLPHISGPFTVKRILRPFKCFPSVHRARAGGSGSGGGRLNNALIQLVGLESPRCSDSGRNETQEGRGGQKITPGNASKINVVVCE